ncbi:hypothetical protein GCM10025877_03240 [Agromyces mangrovi Wang et al. 2018]|nr:hypothetical protein GCM10025877_03240 [Agromyces mangrovi]
MIGAREIAARLGLPAPTDEQCAVIEAPHRAQSLVVAGAGSGKTETMANRVVWLLANGHVAVPEVLGLTFTRKAAGELAERISRRVGQLVHEGIARVELDLLDAAEVSTYNAFASAIYREHAMRIGREPDAALLGEASAWQLARSVVLDSDDERLVELDQSADRITGAVLELSRGIAENVADPRDVRVMARQFLAMADLPTGSARKKTPYATFASAMQQVGGLPVLVDLAERFALEKRRRGLLEFSDQVAFALEICTRHPEVVDAYRDRYGAVLLDEYQDTSVVQTRLLSTLFGGRSVMAVGDPDQSIYGWRGASATNLARFGGDFGDADAPVYDLSTSWRNPRRVLDAANALLRPFLDDPVVPKRALGAAPGAGEGAVELRWGETVEDEAAAVADWFAVRLRGGGRPPSAAMLCRTLKQVDVFAEAFEARGVPFHVLGLAGLLDQPVIADLVSALRVLHDPSAGAELLRLLGGARWQVGAADLAGLAETARWLAARDHALQPLDDDVRARMRASVVAEEHASLVDALDFVVEAPAGHAATARIGEEGLARMRAAGAQLMSLRRRAGLELADLVTLVQHELLLDIEVGANAAQPLGAPSLEAFDELLAGFLDVSEQPTLGAFLGWLAEAEQRDRLAPGRTSPNRAPCRCSRCTAPRGSSGTSSPCHAPSRTSCRRRRCRPRAGSPSASCRTSSRAIATSCPTSPGAACTTRSSSRRRRRSTRPRSVACTRRSSGGSPTWPSRAPGASCCSAGRGGRCRRARGGRARTCTSWWRPACSPRRRCPARACTRRTRARAAGSARRGRSTRWARAGPG